MPTSRGFLCALTVLASSLPWGFSQGSCSNYQCPTNWLPQPSATCAGRCQSPRDRNICCKEQAFCGQFLCPGGWSLKSDAKEIVCNGLTCQKPRDTPRCCHRLEPPKPTTTPPSGQGNCGLFNCPHGLVLRDSAGDINCPGAACFAPRDIGTCCSGTSTTTPRYVVTSEQPSPLPATFTTTPEAALSTPEPEVASTPEPEPVPTLAPEMPTTPGIRANGLPAWLAWLGTTPAPEPEMPSTPAPVTPVTGAPANGWPALPGDPCAVTTSKGLPSYANGLIAAGSVAGVAGIIGGAIAARESAGAQFTLPSTAAPTVAPTAAPTVAPTVAPGLLPTVPPVVVPPAGPPAVTPLPVLYAAPKSVVAAASPSWVLPVLCFFGLFAIFAVASWRARSTSSFDHRVMVPMEIDEESAEHGFCDESQPYEPLSPETVAPLE